MSALDLQELRERADQLEREEGLDQTASMIRAAITEIESLRAEYAAYKQGAELAGLRRRTGQLRRYGFWWARKVTVVEAEDASDALVLFERDRLKTELGLYPIDAVLALADDDCGECCGGRITVPGLICRFCNDTRKRPQQP